MDAGIAMVRARVQTAMQRLKALGAPIDGIAIDNETTLHAANFLGTPGSLAAIERDPRWPALASSMGLPLRVSDMSWGSPVYYLWTERMAARFDAAMNAAPWPLTGITPVLSDPNPSSLRKATSTADAVPATRPIQPAVGVSPRPSGTSTRAPSGRCASFGGSA